MMIDLTVKVQRALWNEAFQNEKMASLAHLGTHFEGMSGLPCRVVAELRD